MIDESQIPHSRQNAIRFFKNYIARNGGAIKNKKVFDLSTGSGYIAHLFEEAGADISVFDLFPEQNTFTKALCQSIDLQNVLPLKDASADLVLLGETIEHLPNQFHFFQEVSRILKKDGVLILTTPNSSSLRSRYSQFLMESEHYSHPAPNEVDAYTRWSEQSEKGYFGKLFISGILRLRTLAGINNLFIKEIHSSQKSSTSILLMIFYPFIYFFSRKNLKRQLKADPEHKSTYQEIFEINTSLGLLLSKHLIVEFQKK